MALERRLRTRLYLLILACVSSLIVFSGFASGGGGSKYCQFRVQSAGGGACCYAQGDMLCQPCGGGGCSPQTIMGGDCDGLYLFPNNGGDCSTTCTMSGCHH